MVLAAVSGVSMAELVGGEAVWRRELAELIDQSIY